MFDFLPHFLLTDGAFASELIERTASTRRVQGIVQLSLAPAFLLGAIAALLNVVNFRLTWIVERVHSIEEAVDKRVAGREAEELPALRKRRFLAQSAVNLSAAAALTICLVIALLFISAFIRPQIGTLVAVFWIVTMVQLVAALLLFLLETRAATRSPRQLRRESREILKRREETSEARIESPQQD